MFRQARRLHYGKRQARGLHYEERFFMSHLNLVSLLGIFVMLAMAWSVSSHRTRVNWRLVGIGILLQAILAAVLFQSRSWTFGGQFENGILFAAVDGFFKSILAWVEEGSSFMFGISGLAADDPTNPQSLLRTFAFGVLPTVIFFQKEDFTSQPIIRK